MKVNLFFRNEKAGFSIYRVFSSFKKYLNEESTCSEFFLPCHRSNFSSLFKNIKYVKNNSKDDAVYHITGDIHYILMFLRRKKTILTIHDTVLLDKEKTIKWYLYFLFWYYFPCMYAKRIICISNSTKNRLISYVGYENKIAVIPNPVSSDFRFVEKSFNKDCPVILHIGTGWNKNLENVIEAIKDIKCNLRIIGKINENIELLLKDNNIIYTNLFNLSEKEIIDEYINCDIVSFPSLYEGFGMPIIEGQATGRCVLTSNLEPMLSVAGKLGALFVDPYNVDSIACGIKRIIENDELRVELVNNGLENVKKYKEEVVFNKYMSIYKEFF